MARAKSSFLRRAFAVVLLSTALSCGFAPAYAQGTENAGEHQPQAAKAVPRGAGDDEGIAVASLDEVPKELLDRLAVEQQIYPGTMTTNADGQEVWTVYDTGDTDTAKVKAVVTLPKGSDVGEKSYLYIRPVAKGEPYYPQDEAIKEHAGEVNDVQCYAIHWVKIYQEDDDSWAYDVRTDSVLGVDDDASTAKVEIEYLNDGAYLKGHQAERKLQVYNSRDNDGSILEENATPTGVTANENAYTGFIFETNRGDPYVFVSKKIFEGYVSSLTVDGILDGTAPFDTDDEAGNDSNEQNKIVRSYDGIVYNLTVNFAARSNLSTATKATLCFEATLDADVTEAVFDLNTMKWLQQAPYKIEYLDGEGKVLYTQQPDGSIVDAAGKTVTLNDIAQGSDQGSDSYTTRVCRQRLTASEDLSADENLLSGNRTLKAAVQVLGAKNESTIQPTFKVWFDGNDDNYGSESAGEGNGVQLAEKVTDNELKPEKVTVSAAARFNLELAKNGNVTHIGWFDSSTGKQINDSNKDSYTVGGKTVTGAQLYKLLEALAALPENAGMSNPEEFTDSAGNCSGLLNGAQLSDYVSVFKNIRYGRITGYGTTLQVYNRATDGASDGSKGFKGISLPEGPISFDLDLQSTISVTEGSADEKQYYAQLWEYNENVDADKGNQDKNLYWASLNSTKYAAWAAPYNTGGGASGCYAGGSWQLNPDGGYHFTVSGYDFNFLPLGLNFPTHRAGNGAPTEGYNVNIGSFSAGYIQVLNVMPRYQTGTLSMGTGVTVKNLEVHTVDGQGISPAKDDPTGYAHESNTKDNSVPDQIPLYQPGGMTKGNAFCDATTYDTKDSDFSSKSRFLGTDFWSTSYDCSGFAGQRITLVGAARIGAGDAQIRHMNMLQLFDSEALSLVEGKEPYVFSKVADTVKGTTTILYAADPDYKGGYNTQDPDVMRYMSTVREEDLLYFTSLDELEKAGYTCVGVLAELRDWTINGEGGYGTALKIPMNISEEERFLGKTVGTVNAVRIWTNADDMKVDGKPVSWADGTYDFEEGKNSVKGYMTPGTGGVGHHSGEVANGTPYEKTEYANGHVILGSNAGGYVYGSSLLILSYKSEVDIAVEKEGASDSPNYSMDVGDTTVNYRLQGIVAKPGDDIGRWQNKTTNLTVLAKLDTDRKDSGDQRIAVAEDSYCMSPASDVMELVDEQGKTLESVKISADPDNPTTVRYRIWDEAHKEHKDYQVQVYAQRDTNGTQVSFEIKGVTIGVAVPDITYDAVINPDAVKDNDTIETTAYISGTEDVRAYETTNGNTDTVSIGIVKQQGTRLAKRVDERHIELNGVIHYTVTYTNSGANPITSIYLYDLLPNTKDIRESHFSGDAILRKVEAELTGGGADDSNKANTTLYYSKTDYKTLHGMVSKFGASVEGGTKDAAAIQKMLDHSDYFHELGTIAGSGELQPSEYLKEQFGDSASGVDTEKLTQEMSEVTGIYAVVKNLQPGVSLRLKTAVETKGNEASDLYRNIANSWLGDESAPLTSNRVETAVLARAIRGVVWDDANLNGIRDEDESLISNVTCTLFRLDEGENSSTKGQYVKVTEDITGTAITPITTTDDGAYSFEKLPAGKYLVAFSGEGLDSYTGATTYRVNDGKDDATSNDAVALGNTESALDTQAEAIQGLDGTYRYAIAYSLTDETVGEGGDQTVQHRVNSTDLHSIEEIEGQNIQLTNSVELYENLDCGLVRKADFELPETGGTGTAAFFVGGCLLVITGAVGACALRQRREGDISMQGNTSGKGR